MFVTFYFIIFLSFTDYKILDKLIEDTDGQLNDEETEDLDDIKDLVEDLDGKLKDLVEHLVKGDQDIGDEMEESGEVGENNQYY